MTPEAAAADALLAGKGKEVPRFLFVAADYSDVTVVEAGKLSVSGLWKSMVAEANKFYKGDLDKNVRQMLKVLGEFDKINNERNLLEEKSKREDKPSASDIAKIKKEREDLNEREKKANAERDALLKLERKAA
jgi:hypothetical protein